MRLLLDTHIALWAITDSPKLPQKARELLLDPAAEIFVSTASIWEIAIKHSLSRGNMPVSSSEAIRYFSEAGYTLLPVSAIHAAATETLPPIHGDPFDRMLVAQAMTEPLRLVTHDEMVARYGDGVLLV